MKAVNLIPPEQRRAGAGGPGRSGPAVYVVLGVLGVLLVGVAVMVFTTNSINSRKAELAKVSREASQVEAQANALKPYRDFATLREKRLATVAALVASRFDWERTMSQLARVLPPTVSLTSLTGSVAPGTVPAGGGTGGNSLRSAINAPAVDLVGCASSQADVSRVMSRLRRMSDVTKVALAASEKRDEETGDGGSGAEAGEDADCRAGSEQRPQFTITVFFKPLLGAAQTAPGAPGTAPAPAPAGGAPQTQPASTPPPAAP